MAHTLLSIQLSLVHSGPDLHQVFCSSQPWLSGLRLACGHMRTRATSLKHSPELAWNPLTVGPVDSRPPSGCSHFLLQPCFIHPGLAGAADTLFFQTPPSPSPPSWMASTHRKCGLATQWSCPAPPPATPSLPSAGSRMAGPSLPTAAGPSASQG